MNISKRNIDSITYAMEHGIEKLRGVLRDGLVDGLEKDAPRLVQKFRDDINEAKRLLELLQNMSYMDGQLTFEFECDTCDGKGHIDSCDEQGNDEIQRCDECCIFESDEDARKHLS